MSIYQSVIKNVIAMRKSSLVVVAILFISTFAFSALAAGGISPSPKKPVSFRVEVGKPVCKDGVGVASVLFATDPPEGGSYEIFGAAIEQSSMTLDRRVSLKTGTYTWKGVVNEKYYEIPPSIGQFTIPSCEAIPKSATSSVVSRPSVSMSKDVPKTASASNAAAISIAKMTEDGSESSVAGTGSASEENIPKKETESRFSPQIIIAGLAILGLIIGYFGLKKKENK